MTTTGTTPAKPPPAEDANELLGSIVREHLQRAAQGRSARGGAPAQHPPGAPDEERPESSAPTAAPEKDASESSNGADEAALETAAATLGSVQSGAGVEQALEATARDAEMLQRELEALFAAEPRVKPARPGRRGGQPSEAPAVPAPDASPAGPAPLDVSQATVSPAELDALLSADADSLVAESAAELGGPGPAPTLDAGTVAAAEGVLAEELEQLVANDDDGSVAPESDGLTESAAVLEALQAEAPGEAPADLLAATGDADALATPGGPAAMLRMPEAAPEREPEPIVEHGAPLAAAPEGPGAIAIPSPFVPTQPAADLRVPAVPAQAPPRDPPATPRPATAEPAAPAAMTPAALGQMPPPVIIEAPEESEDDAPARAPRGQWIRDLGVMALQLVDLPFRWVSDADRYLIGIAAFLLLLGGFVLWVVSWMIK